MTDLTQYSEKVRKIYDMKNNPTKVKDTFYKNYSSYSGEEGVSEGHSQSWFHCSFGEQGRIISYFFTCMVSLCDQIIITIKFEEKRVDGDEDQNFGNEDQNHGDQVSPELPMTQEEAMRFQEENLAAAVTLLMMTLMMELMMNLVMMTRALKVMVMSKVKTVITMMMMS